MAGREPAVNPTNRGKLGWKWSILTDRHGIPIGWTGRRRMVALCRRARGTIEAVAERFQIDAKTVRKWRDRFLNEGPDELLDRSRASPAPLARGGDHRRAVRCTSRRACD